MRGLNQQKLFHRNNSENFVFEKTHELVLFHMAELPSSSNIGETL